MSEASKRRIKRLIKLLKEHGCEQVITVEWTSAKVRFMCKDVELSDWMPPIRGLAWIQGYLIGVGHKWAKELDI
jgi:hypothetical protein